MSRTISFRFLLAVITAGLTLQSCQDEVKPAAPVVEAPTAVTSVQVSAKTDITFTFTAPGKFASASVTATGGSATVKTPPAANAKEGTVVVEFTAGNTAGAGSVVLTITDGSNQVGTATAVLNITLSAPPTVALSATTGSGIPGSTVSVTANITAANGASSLTVTGATVSPASPIAISGTSASQAVSVTIPANAVVGSTILVVFTAKDAQNLNSTAVTFTITVLDPVIQLQGTLTTQTLDASKPYLLVGQVFIPNGVTLTVPAGTVIKGDKATKAVLVVQPGGKLIANGTANNPIVFTSNQDVNARDRGDWGGIVILGNAYVNQSARPAVEGITPTQNYGTIGSDPTVNATENSGSLQYVRIEYAGIELTPNNETNSITFGGVGNGTTVSYVQTSFGGDDNFEWFGGTVNGKYLVSHSGWDDDFDTDFGWGGNVQFGLVVRNTFFADQSGSNAFESDNQANGNTIAGVCDGSTQAGCTRGVFSNITVLGPRDIQSRSISANYQNAIHIRRRTAISIFNSFISGFRIGVRLDDQGTLDNLVAAAGVHQYNVLSVPGSIVTGSTTTAADAAFATGLSSGDASTVSTYWSNNNNGVFNAIAADSVIGNRGIQTAAFWSSKTAATYPSDPDFTLVAGRTTGPLGALNLNSGANFTNAKLSGGFFTTTTYRGAFGSTDWTNGWTEFRPLTKVY